MSAGTRHAFGPYSGASRGEGHPVMFGSPPPARHFDAFPDGGGYPKGFVEWALAEMGCPDASAVLHLCAGSMVTGVRLDCREAMRPTVMADCREAPFRAESFDWLLADPPYSEEWARNLYDTEARYPRPGQIVAEAARLLRPGGRLGLLHFMVPHAWQPMRLVRVHGVTTGSGYAIRAWSLRAQRTDQRELLPRGEQP